MSAHQETHSTRITFITQSIRNISVLNTLVFHSLVFGVIR